MAESSGMKRPLIKVVTNTKASDFVVKFTILMACRSIKEIPIVITSTARAHWGINWTEDPNRRAAIIKIKPLIQLDNTVFAPLLKQSVERVSDPEAGIPEKKAQPILAIPMENIAWLPYNLEPVLAASDFPIEIPSIIQSKAMATAVLITA